METVSKVVGLLATNVHILADERTREAIAIDTAIPSLEWVQVELAARQWTLKLIVSTHGHWDHMGDNARVAEHTGALIAVHELDAHRLTNPPEARWAPLEIPPCIPAVELQEGGEIRFGSIRLEVLHTPGHTAGSISLWEAGTGTLFTGDAFYVDDKLSWDDREAFLRSLERIRELPAEVVHAGHGRTFGRDELRSGIDRELA